MDFKLMYEFAPITTEEALVGATIALGTVVLLIVALRIHNYWIGRGKPNMEKEEEVKAALNFCLLQMQMKGKLTIEEKNEWAEKLGLLKDEIKPRRKSLSEITTSAA